MDTIIAKTNGLMLTCATAVLLFALAGTALAEEVTDPTPTVAEQVLGLEVMCAENSEAMAARHSEKPLYERLGGEKKIHEIVVEIVRLHEENKSIMHLLDGVDKERLIHGVTQFLVAGSGGPAKYEGRSMVDAHAHLELTNADFLAAGGDVMQAMKNKGCAEAEIQEVVCALVSFRPAVVIESEKLVQ